MVSYPRSRHVLWPELCDQLKTGDWEELDEMERITLLALDDVGSEYDPTGIMVQKLCWLLERRENRWSILTTNLHPNTWETAWTKRGLSRLLRHSEIVSLEGVKDFSA